MITVKKLEFVKALERCGKIAQQKAISPHHAHIKIAFDAVLTYAATNGSTHLVGKLDASGKPEAFTANAKDLLSYCGSILGDTVKLSVGKEDRKLTITGEGKRRFTLPTLAAADFPKIEWDNGASLAMIDGAQLRSAIDRVQFAAATDKGATPGLECIKLEIEDGILKTTATDGNAVIAIVTDAIDITTTISALLSRSNVPSILAIGDEKIGVYLSSGSVGFRTPNETLIAQAVQAGFPAIEAAVARVKSPNRVEIQAPRLLDAVAAVRMADAMNNITLVFSDGEIPVDGGQENGDRYATDAVESLGKDSGRVTVAAERLTAALRACANATLEFGSPKDPVVITDGIFKAIISPIMP